MKWVLHQNLPLLRAHAIKNAICFNSSKASYGKQVSSRRLLDVLSFCDGNHTVFDIVNIED